MFQRAVRHEVKLRIGLAGPSGSGKTYSALRVATALAQGGRVAVLDTERDSAQLYAGEKTDDGVLDFDVAVLPDFRPQTFTAALKAAAKEGYAVVVIDSLSHAWEGILDLKDATGAGFDAWKKVTPVHNELVDMILRYPGHVIACVRVKTEYVVEEVEKNGRKQNVPKKVGLAPVARAGMEYEFTVFGDLEPGTNTLTISKTRCSALNGRSWRQPGAEFAKVLLDWLAGASPAPAHRPELPGRDDRLVAALGKLGIDYERARQWAIAMGRPDPDTAPDSDRRALYADLRGEGRPAFNDWLDGQTESA